jgi:folate-dependent phosphoribosylglycinamide formyltransferase PurN
MQTSDAQFAYIGTSDSYFTRKFLPALQQLQHSKLIFICIHQEELIIIPEKAGLLLKLFIYLKILKSSLKEISSLFYWNVFCNQHQIRFEKSMSVNSEYVKELIANCDLVLTAGIRCKINTEIIRSAKNGIINFHYSLLPKYRGTNPVFWQKINGDHNFGYTFHKIDEKLDHGDILLQKQVDIAIHKTVPEICDRLTDHAANNLFLLINNLQQATTQNEQLSSEFTNKDFLNYIHIESKEPGSVWKEKCKTNRIFIFNSRWIVNMEIYSCIGVKNKLSLTGTFNKDGHCFKFKKINYLPPVFYYFAMRNYFE